MRAKKRLLPEDNYFCELGYCCVLVKDFVKHYCNNDVANLFDFSFLKILDDEKFGDVGINGGKKKYASVANSKIAKAIYFIIFAEMIPKLSVEDLFGNSLYYKGVFLNEFSTLFSEDYSLKTINNIFSKDKYEKFRKRIASFYNKINTIGNFIILPNLPIKKEENNYKNINLSTFNNYFNFLLNELNKVFNNSRDKDYQLSLLVEANEFYFNSDFIDMNILDFCNTNKVEDYINDEFFNSLNIQNSFKYSDLIINKDLDIKDKFVDFANIYMDKTEQIIDKRSNYIISILKEKLV